VQITFDPWISEWGNPSVIRRIYRVIDRRTRGTETSKYPEEEKTKVISRVVASEMEIAQTRVVQAILGL
jgi:hypothetical protein